MQPAGITIDTLLRHAKETLNPEQLTRLMALENSVSRGDVKDQQIHVYHQLARFWGDSVGNFEVFAWYEAEAARLENSEKNLTFAAHLFLNSLRAEGNPAIQNWKALQAKDLFERSLKLNPRNDSSVVGLGAVYIFGNISANPMEGILKVREVAERDSTNVFAQMTLGHGSMLSGQMDKAVARFESVYAVQPENLEAILVLAELYERRDDKVTAIKWYKRSLPLIRQEMIREEVEKRIAALGKN